MHLETAVTVLLAWATPGALAVAPTAEHYFNMNPVNGVVKVRVCKHAWYEDCTILGGRYNTCYNIPGAWDDKISSLMVPHWVNICTFNEHPDCGGFGVIVPGHDQIDDLGLFPVNDKISSFRCY